jgi:hypothetical protein
MSKINFDEIDRQEWRKLGFYYLFSDNEKAWELFGDRKGLQNLSTILSVYCSKTKNTPLGEHIHIGPHSYLKVVTWDIPFVSEAGIFGSLEDLKKLAQLLERKIAITPMGGSCKIKNDYSNSSNVSIRLHVLSDGIDPSSLDGIIKKKEGHQPD